MVARQVAAVWFWRYLESPFRAVYGRRPGNQYTKDYLQASGDCAEALDELFPRGTQDALDIEYRWPGGHTDGRIFPGTDDDPPARRRIEVRWNTGHSPEPWRLYPADHALRTFPGVPDLPTAGAANEQLGTLKEADVDPWIVATKLHDEFNVLHVRAYLGRPPEGLEHASTEALPPAVREAMSRLPGNSGCGVIRATGHFRANDLVERIIAAWERSPNVLLVGPPATGKTVALEDLQARFGEGGGVMLFDPERLHDCWPSVDDTPRKALSVVFHPSYSYEEFVLGLIPKGGVGFELVARPGPLLSLAHWASEEGNQALLIADEFNRGNAAAIFGDTLALLDRDKRADPTVGQAGAAIARAYPDQDVEVAPSYGTVAAGRIVGERITLPASLRIVGALNSSDRSVAPLDAALRRRFAILRTQPDYDVLSRHLGLATPAPRTVPNDQVASWTREDALGLAVNLLRELNARLELVIGEDFLLGHGLLWRVGGESAAAVVQSLADAFDEQIAASLRMTFADQDELLAAVLGVEEPPAVGVATPSGTIPEVAEWILPSAAIAGVATPRLRLMRIGDLSWEDAAARLRTMVA